MKLKNNEALAVVYADLFDFALTRDEAKVWGIEDRRRVVGQVGKENKYLFLPGREKLVGFRRERERISQSKLIKLNKLIRLIAKIPTVEAVFVTGSVAVGNAKEEADLDLMIIVTPGSLWLTRLWVVGGLKMVGKYRSSKEFKDKVCTNLFLSSDRLKIESEGLYEAHEVLQAKCLYDRGGVERKWLVDNQWVGKYLPNAYQRCQRRVGESQYCGRKWGWVFLPVELMCFLGQRLYMKRKVTSERVGFKQAFFHPNNLSLVVAKKFEQRVAKYLAEV